MSELIIKQFNSEEFNDYSQDIINKKVEAINMYMSVVSNGVYGNYNTDILLARLPDKQSEQYSEINAVKQFIDQIDGVNGNSKVFFLLKDNKPVSLAIYTQSQMQSDAYILELIKTKDDEQSNGYASILVKESFAALKDEAFEIIAKINENNNQSLGFIGVLNQNSLAYNKKLNAVCKVVSKSYDVYEARFYISDMAINFYKQKQQEQEKE